MSESELRLKWVIKRVSVKVRLSEREQYVVSEGSGEGSSSYLSTALISAVFSLNALVPAN